MNRDDAPDEYDHDLDSLLSYLDAIAEIGKRVKAGEPLPDMFKPTRDWGGEK